MCVGAVALGQAPQILFKRIQLRMTQRRILYTCKSSNLFEFLIFNRSFDLWVLRVESNLPLQVFHPILFYYGVPDVSQEYNCQKLGNFDSSSKIKNLAMKLINEQRFFYEKWLVNSIIWFVSKMIIYLFSIDLGSILFEFMCNSTFEIK